MKYICRVKGFSYIFQFWSDVTLWLQLQAGALAERNVNDLQFFFSGEEDMDM